MPPRSAGLIVEDQLARPASGLVVSDNGAWAAAYYATFSSDLTSASRKRFGRSPITHLRSFRWPSAAMERGWSAATIRARSSSATRRTGVSFGGSTTRGRSPWRFRRRQPYLRRHARRGAFRLGCRQRQPAGHTGLRRRHQLDVHQSRRHRAGPRLGRPRRRRQDLGTGHRPLPRRSPRAPRRSHCAWSGRATASRC